jgi:hypothetical protein
VLIEITRIGMYKISQRLQDFMGASYGIILLIEHKVKAEDIFRFQELNELLRIHDG